mmetsp:Transcript_42491/g.83771  ORF Transcript_42491/g.83771 Transcript_42491/m.83771 type:complete len:248 (-) Transcript_42491:103-846(-)
MIWVAAVPPGCWLFPLAIDAVSSGSSSPPRFLRITDHWGEMLGHWGRLSGPSERIRTVSVQQRSVVQPPEGQKRSAASSTGTNRGAVQLLAKVSQVWSQQREGVQPLSPLQAMASAPSFRVLKPASAHAVSSNSSEQLGTQQVVDVQPSLTLQKISSAGVRGIERNMGVQVKPSQVFSLIRTSFLSPKSVLSPSPKSGNLRPFTSKSRSNFEKSKAAVAVATITVATVAPNFILYPRALFSIRRVCR